VKKAKKNHEGVKAKLEKHLKFQSCQRVEVLPVYDRSGLIDRFCG